MGGREGVIATVVLGIVEVVGGWLAGTVLNVADVTGINLEASWLPWSEPSSSWRCTEGSAGGVARSDDPVGGERGPCPPRPDPPQGSGCIRWRVECRGSDDSRRADGDIRMDRLRVARGRRVPGPTFDHRAGGVSQHPRRHRARRRGRGVRHALLRLAGRVAHLQDEPGRRSWTLDREPSGPRSDFCSAGSASSARTGTRSRAAGRRQTTAPPGRRLSPHLSRI